MPTQKWLKEGPNSIKRPKQPTKRLLDQVFPPIVQKGMKGVGDQFFPQVNPQQGMKNAANQIFPPVVQRGMKGLGNQASQVTPYLEDPLGSPEAQEMIHRLYQHLFPDVSGLQAPIPDHVVRYLVHQVFNQVLPPIVQQGMARTMNQVFPPLVQRGMQGVGNQATWLMKYLLGKQAKR